MNASFYSRGPVQGIPQRVMRRTMDQPPVTTINPNIARVPAHADNRKGTK